MYDGGVLELFSGDQRALLAGIAACPDDDAPKLVYADWLDEYAGNGEYVRWATRALHSWIPRIQIPGGDRRPGDDPWGPPGYCRRGRVRDRLERFPARTASGIGAGRESVRVGGAEPAGVAGSTIIAR
jgi:uncharacterized protein (TIGR02996 family)